MKFFLFFFFQAEDGIRDKLVTGVQTCALPICGRSANATAAPTTANKGARFPSAPAAPGPIMRFASYVRSVTNAGYTRPITRNVPAARLFHWLKSRKKTANAHRISARKGMLTRLPSLGRTWRRPNCVKTNARPKKKDADSAKTAGRLNNNIRPSRYCRTHSVAASPRAMFVFGHQGDPVRSLVLRESCSHGLNDANCF